MASHHAHHGTQVGATEDSTLISGTHGRARRFERDIHKIDLQRARRYGMKEAGHRGNEKYTYGGVVFIYDPKTKREVTSWRSADLSFDSSGTKCSQPVLLPKAEWCNNRSHVEYHAQLQSKALKDMDSWTSHSVLVVDMSGSMRRDDVNGARCRSDGVWMTLARDYVKKPLDNKSRSPTDLISVVVMREEAEVVLVCEPTDYVLYNKLIDMREWTTIRPRGAGNYMPALDLAESLMMLNQKGTCALSLLFFSDGRPSDRGDFADRAGNMASKFGRRLSFTCIGMAEEGEDFSTLHGMVTEAESYGAVASFGKPTLDADSLSHIISNLASSLTTSKTEMTELATGKPKTVRMDVIREKKGVVDDIIPTNDWWNYTKGAVHTFYRWSYEKDDFVEVWDNRCECCWSNTGIVDASRKNSCDDGAFVCPGCKCACFCSLNCWNESNRANGHECDHRLARVRNKEILFKSIPSFSVAVKSKIFGEGAERMVRKFGFLDDCGMFTGPKMVAKESRFLPEDDNYDRRLSYHAEFMRTQAIAAEMAKKFNAAIDGLNGHFGPEHIGWVERLPRVAFLEPMVVEVNDAKFGDYCYLIEPLLEGMYEKFNNNMGYVKGQAKQQVPAEPDNMELLERSFRGINFDLYDKGAASGLGAIEEGSEEGDSDDELFDTTTSGPASMTYSNIHEKDFPQAFSHFTYEKSRKRLMVVDLQGVFEINSDGTRCYQLTDPVIHKHRRKSRKRFRKWTFGRTDRGEKGMKAFFESHECSEVCKLLGLHAFD